MDGRLSSLPQNLGRERATECPDVAVKEALLIEYSPVALKNCRRICLTIADVTGKRVVVICNLFINCGAS
jgi:hypothetical protein